MSDCSLKILIVDDEKHARDKIKHFITRFNTQSHHELAEAEDGLKALELIKSWQPQVVVADVDMPHLNGLEMVKKLPKHKKPFVVFTTAYEEYALEAFEVEAVDYLLKPFAYDRFEQSIGRVLTRIDLLKSTSEEQSETEDQQYLTHIRVEGRGKLQSLLALEQIHWIKASGNYCEFYTEEDRSFIRRGTLKELIARLSPEVFLRLNRSQVVQIAQIKSVEVIAHGDATVTLKNGLSLKWSRHYRAENGALFEV